MREAVSGVSAIEAGTAADGAVTTSAGAGTAVAAEGDGAACGLATGGLDVSQALTIAISAMAAAHLQNWIFRAESFMMGRQYKGNRGYGNLIVVLAGSVWRCGTGGASGVVDLAASTKRRKRRNR